MQCTAALPGGSGQWNSCNALTHSLGAVGSGTPATHCLTAKGRSAVGLLQHTIRLPGDSGQWSSGNALPHCLRPAGSGTPAMHCLIALGEWAEELLQCTASLPHCTALPLWMGAVGSATLQRTASLLRGSGQWNSCNAPPRCLAAVGRGTPAMHCLTAWGQWALELLQHIASLPGAVGGGTPSGRQDSNKALPHCPGAPGSGTPATHRLTARGQWAVGLLVGGGTPAMHYLSDWGQ